MGPAATTSVYQPYSPVNGAVTQSAGPPAEPEQAEIQAPESETERPHTAWPDQRGATFPPELTATPAPVLDLLDYDQTNWVESVPVRGDVLSPLPLPPLPTLRPQPDRLDISHEGEDEDLIGSGRDESSSSGSGDSSGANGPQEVDTPSAPSHDVTPGAGPAVQNASRSQVRQDLVPEVVVRQIQITASELPDELRGSGQQPAVVFKEDSTLTPLSQLPSLPGGDESAKPPFHLIIVNVHDQNQSGELKASCAASRAVFATKATTIPFVWIRQHSLVTQHHIDHGSTTTIAALHLPWRSSVLFGSGACNPNEVV